MQSLETEGGLLCSDIFVQLPRPLKYKPALCIKGENNLPCCKIHQTSGVLAAAAVRGGKFLLLPPAACAWVEMAPCKSADTETETTGVQKLQSKLFCSTDIALQQLSSPKITLI